MTGMRSIILYLILICSCSLRTFGQHNIHGTIKNRESSPIEFATVSLQKDTVIVKSTLSNNTGAYFFDNVLPGQYRLIFSCVNYRKEYVDVVTKDSLNVNIVLQPDTGKLAVVSVAAKKPLIERRVDRYIVNVA